MRGGEAEAKLRREKERGRRKHGEGEREREKRRRRSETTDEGRPEERRHTQRTKEPISWTPAAAELARLQRTFGPRASPCGPPAPALLPQRPTNACVCACVRRRTTCSSAQTSTYFDLRAPASRGLTCSHEKAKALELGH
eukprot:5560654-Pleurochrysis_carterae.AAC.1